MWHSITIEETLKKLKTTEKGLSNEEIQKRLEQNGMNVLPKKEVDPFIKIFLRQFLEPMEILLIISMIVSFCIGEVIDGTAILIIIMADVIMGAVQENHALKEAESLGNLIKVNTNVLRDGKKSEIDSSYLVPGDIVLLEPGDKVSADLRILECANLQIDESILTGESLAVSKSNEVLSEETALANRSNMAYAGTNVLTGRATCVVVATALETEVGKVANQVAMTEEEKSPLTIRMEKFIKQITKLIVVVGVITAIVLLIKDTPTSEVFLSVIALSVSAMPEGLGLALTMALTIASNRMSKNNVIVKKLKSAEALGSCTVIASDKTGTLTVNEQTAKKIMLPDNSSFLVYGTGYNDNGKIVIENDGDINEVNFIAKMGVLNNEAGLERVKDKFITRGDSIDIAFLALGMKAKVNTSKTEIIERIPYESENKYSAVKYIEDGKTYWTAKGSMEVILKYCSDMKVNGKYVTLDKNLIEKQNEALARQGYRVIALASKETNDLSNLHFLGLVAFIDPVREEVRESINECKTAGIKVLMITGDHPLTAYSIASDLKIVNNFEEVTTGLEVDKYLELGEEEFDRFVKTKKVFTRVTPLNKLEIVKSLKRQGEFVAVTGDGVNDAPAIKSANIGVAMGSGTDVAKETASLIILDDNFKSIVAGVKEGRNAYSNIRKVSYMLLSCGVAEVLFFILSVLLDMPIPLVAVQLLWLNLVTDGLQDFALSFEKSEKDIMKNKPQNPKESMFNKELLSEVLVSGLTIGLLVFGVWIYLLNYLNMDVSLARGYVMTLMVFIQNVHVFNCRSEKHSAFTVSLRSNYWVLFAVGSAVGLQLIVSEVPMFSRLLQTSSVPPLHLLYLFILSLSIILVMEVYKKIKYHETIDK